MKAIEHLPPIPAPPHDPKSLLLAGWLDREPTLGFRGASFDRIDVEPACNSLVLAPAPDTRRFMTEPSGSFGGWRPPLNVAVSDAGAVFLLDPVTGHLARFDACTCRFEQVPCLARVDRCDPGAERHRYVASDRVCEPHGIAVRGHELFVADSGHARVLRFDTDGFIPRGVLRLPASERANRSRPWYPFGVAIGACGTLYVSDPHNQCVDVFDGSGRWRAAWRVSQSPWALNLNEAGVLFAVIATADDLVSTPGTRSHWQWVTSATAVFVPAVVKFVDGVEVAVDAGAAASARFAAPRVVVDADGCLHLPCVDAAGDFDSRGIALPAQQRVMRDLYQHGGVFQTVALDSGIENCTWHRIELRGSLPPGCRIGVATLCSDVELEADELAALPETAWSETQWATRSGDADWLRGTWDCLIRSLPGRFCWMRLEFVGDGHATPLVCAIVAEFPRISLRRYLPAVFGTDPQAADFTDRFTAIFDATLRSIERRLDRQAENFDPLSASSERGKDGAPDFLSWLASWIGITLSRGLSESRQRRMIKDAARLYGLRGTAKGLRGQLLLLLGFNERLDDCAAQRPQRRCVPAALNCGLAPAKTPACPPPLLLEHFRLRRWLFAGRGRLGDDSMLWGKSIVNRSELSGNDLGPNRTGNAQLGVTRIDTVPDPRRDPLLVYAHRLSVFVPARVRACDAERRAFEQLLARETPAHVACEVHYVEPRFRVGQQAMLGLDSVIARTPPVIELGANRLGQGTMVGVSPGRPARGTRIGDDRVGTTTVIT